MKRHGTLAVAVAVVAMAGAPGFAAAAGGNVGGGGAGGGGGHSSSGGSSGGGGGASSSGGSTSHSSSGGSVSHGSSSGTQRSGGSSASSRGTAPVTSNRPGASRQDRSYRPEPGHGRGQGWRRGSTSPLGGPDGWGFAVPPVILFDFGWPFWGIGAPSDTAYFLGSFYSTEGMDSGEAGAPPPGPSAEANDASRSSVPSVDLEDGEGVLQIDVWPKDAAIYVDGNAYGTGVETSALPLPVGHHWVEFVRPGYRAYAQDVLVLDGRTVHLDIELEPVRSRD